MSTQPPTLNDYFDAIQRVARLLRKAFEEPGSVKRSELRTALENFEKLDYDAMG